MATNNNANGSPNEERPRHKYGNPKGGMTLYDEGNIIPSVVKEVLGKIAHKAVKGQF
jgi:hypothetical protein